MRSGPANQSRGLVSEGAENSAFGTVELAEELGKFRVDDPRLSAASTSVAAPVGET